MHDDESINFYAEFFEDEAVNAVTVSSASYLQMCDLDDMWFQLNGAT